MTEGEKRIRYAVVGLGWFAQRAILPAFFHAARNSELVALVGADEEKRATLGARWNVAHVVGYERLDELLASGEVDAVWLAVPNTLHADLCVRAARARVHVLCERPLCVTEEEGARMIAACHAAHVKLMTAYRLHFDPAHADAMEAIASGKLGEVRLFSSLFTMQVLEGNIRTRSSLGGGPLYDLGVECINAARHVMRDEPTEVVAFTGGRGREARFSEVEEQVAATMRFSRDRLATITLGFGAASVSTYDVVGTDGSLRLDAAWELDAEIERTLVVGERVRRHRYAAHDQVAPELVHFSDCILRDEVPEPSGEEGLVDVRIVRALYRSAHEGRAIALEGLRRQLHPSELSMEIPADQPHPPLVHAHGPARH
jgi:glucose-fructose oxidoreductase